MSLNVYKMTNLENKDRKIKNKKWLQKINNILKKI